MSVVGIDYGNLSALVAQAAKGGVDVILNDASNRQTATCVSIQGKQRFIGDSGAALQRTNLKNTVLGMKLLVGRKFDEQGVQDELKKSAFKAQKLPNGGIGVSITYNEEELVVPMEHLMAMMLVQVKDIAAKANNNLQVRRPPTPSHHQTLSDTQTDEPNPCSVSLPGRRGCAGCALLVHGRTAPGPAGCLRDRTAQLPQGTALPSSQANQRMD